MHVIEQPLPPAPEAGAEPNIVAQWTALYDAHTEIACLMLGSMTPELHRQFELHYPYDMKEGKSEVADMSLRKRILSNWHVLVLICTIGYLSRLNP
ncbi:hypothetical protein Tco_0191314 [Tanacetum coccineum]